MEQGPGRELPTAMEMGMERQEPGQQTIEQTTVSKGTQRIAGHSLGLPKRSDWGLKGFPQERQKKKRREMERRCRPRR